jgi:phosphoribosyl-dephospho-CoA transferase
MVMKLDLEAHDLLWGMAADCLADDAPLWAKEVLLRGDPVVVRRAITPVDFVINDMHHKCHDLLLPNNLSQKH